MNTTRISACLAVLLLLATVGSQLRLVQAADHREAPAVNGAGEGDITDVFAFLDPTDANRVVLIMGVNPFSVPAVQGGYKFSPDFLYQFKIDNTGDYVEDLVVQITFDGLPPAQTMRVHIQSPSPAMTGAINQRFARFPDLEGAAGGVITAGELMAFSGLRDDPFVVDIGQLNRILNSTQDVFRGFTTPVPAIGALRGRPARGDGTSGVDAFGGFNVSFMAVSFPKRWIGDSGRVSIWGTVSAPLGGGSYVQFERNGQPLFSTVFVPGPLRDAFNAAVPADDVARFSNLVPDALTTTDNDGTGNTIAGRRTVLGALGLTALPNGAPLLLPAGFANTNRNLLRVALLPDVLRLDLGLASDNLAIGQFGLSNGRRPGDDVVDILLRVARELADVNFPAALGVPGSGPARPAALPLSDRRVFAVLQGTDFIGGNAALTDLSGSGNERPISNVFPFLPLAHPLPGADGTIGFPIL
ncbi:MAG: DUF4331 family protein [Bryobacteraceae bacterium]